MPIWIPEFRLKWQHFDSSSSDQVEASIHDSNEWKTFSIYRQICTFSPHTKPVLYYYVFVAIFRCEQKAEKKLMKTHFVKCCGWQPRRWKLLPKNPPKLVCFSEEAWASDTLWPSSLKRATSHHRAPCICLIVGICLLRQLTFCCIRHEARASPTHTKQIQLHSNFRALHCSSFLSLLCSSSLFLLLLLYCSRLFYVCVLSAQRMQPEWPAGRQAMMCHSRKPSSPTQSMPLRPCCSPRNNIKFICSSAVAVKRSRRASLKHTILQHSKQTGAKTCKFPNRRIKCLPEELIPRSTHCFVRRWRVHSFIIIIISSVRRAFAIRQKQMPPRSRVLAMNGDVETSGQVETFLCPLFFGLICYSCYSWPEHFAVCWSMILSQFEQRRFCC